MARRFYSSTAARTTLAAGVDGSQTTMSVTAVSGWPTSFPYTLVIDQDTVNEELVEVTGRTGTTITVTRGIDGTSGTSHDAGAVVQHGVSARDFDEPNAFINGTGTVTETLLASNAVTSAKILDGTIVNADINASAAIAQSKIANLTSDLASKVDYATPVNTQTGVSYTFVGDDAFRLTTSNSASAVTFTIPAASAVAWEDDTILRVVNYGAGALTVAGGSGVTVTNTATTLAQYESGAAIRTGSDAWTLVPFSGGGGLSYATISSPSATGQYTDGNGDTWDYFTFTASGSLVVSTAGLVQILAVGGGGGCADSSGADAGGGGGGVRFGIFEATAATHTVTIGAGGAGSGSSSGSVTSTEGSATSVGTIIKIGGGSNAKARSGSLINFSSHGGGGGGGATAVTAGGTVNPTQAGAGAGGSVFGSNNWDGLANDYTGSSVTYGTGGEGNGAGSANTGDGGAYQGLSGGSGIVVVRVKV